MGKEPDDSPPKKRRIRPIPFGEHRGPEPFNASEIVALDDARFLFCDNNIGDGLLELRLTADGTMDGPLLRRPLAGIEPGTVDDLEGMTRVDVDGRRHLFVTPSFSLKKRKGKYKKKSQRGKESAARNCLVRVSLGENDRLEAEVVRGFRDWIVENAPILGKAPRYVPDDGGLNVEGLGWSARDQALLLGVRTPVVDGKPIVLRVRLRSLDGVGDLSNFEMLPPVLLAVEGEEDEQGIRAMEYDESRGVTLIVMGNSTSASEAPFMLYSWDGNAEGRVRRFEEVRFHKKMKVEGVTHGQVHGRGAVVFVDDAGGYQVLWDDDPRLTRQTAKQGEAR